MKITSVLLLVMVILTGCGSSPETNPDEGIFFNDFENLSFWTEAGNLNKDKGRNGSSCMLVNGDFEYSPVFKAKLSDIKIKNPKKVFLTGWMKVFDMKSSASLVLCLHYNGENLVYAGSWTKDHIRKAGVWTKVESEIKIPTGSPADAQIVVYGFRTGPGEVFFDDIEIKVDN